MVKVFVAVLNAHFKNCLYGTNLIQRLSDLVNNEFPIIETYNDGSIAKIDINGTCTIEFVLNANGYIKTINVHKK